MSELPRPEAPPQELQGLTAAEGERTLPPASGDSSTRPSMPGYEVLGELGRGGMGVVYKARQTTLKRLVALKVLLAGEHSATHDLSRFQAEAEAIARLAHPNIVQIYEFGTHASLPFLALEFCPGGSLEKKLARGPLPPREAAQLVQSLAQAMQAAHNRKVIHRDLKPANVLLAEDGTPKVTDFGLARKLDETAHTQSGVILGTPSYMAPEQAQGKVREVGPEADIYALGAILYQCLTGLPPFQGQTPFDTILQLLTEDPVAPRRRRRDVPVDLDTVCLKCLQKAPSRRYATAQALADDLGRWLSGAAIHARPVGRAEKAWRSVRRRPAVVLSALLALVCLAGGFGGYRRWQRGAAATNEEPEVGFLSTVQSPEEEPVPGPPASQQDAERAGGYRVVKRGKRIESVEAVGNASRLLRHNPYHLLAMREPGDGLRFEASYRYLRDPDGTLLEVTAHTPDGTELWSLRHEGERRLFHEGKAGTAKHAFEVVEEGASRWIRCPGADGQPGRAGRHGLRVSESTDGKVLTLTFVNDRGEPVRDEPSRQVRRGTMARSTRPTSTRAATRSLGPTAFTPWWAAGCRAAPIASRGWTRQAGRCATRRARRAWSADSGPTARRSSEPGGPSTCRID
jgi:hypothetical protein